MNASHGRYAVKHPVLWLASVLLLSGCSQIDAIPTSPPQTPEAWLSIQPFAQIDIASQTVILVQPSTSAIVYFLGILTIGVGLYFLRIRHGQVSRLWWGIALLLWGIGALLGAWAWLALTMAAYFVYLLSGLTQTLWAQGRWFSENDVLHIGLILWMIYLALVVAPRVRDEPEIHP